MPDRLFENAERRFAGVLDEIDDYVATVFAGERLHPHVVARYGAGRYRAGWTLEVDFPDRPRELHLLADEALPYSAPRVALADSPPVLEWPHLEPNGLLCVLPASASVSAECPVDVVQHVVGAACGLIEDCLRRGNTEDFRDEFLSYWSNAADPRAVPIVSLIEPRGPGRRITIVRGVNTGFAAEDGETLKRWLARRGLTSGGVNPRLHDGVLIWLPEPALPSEYPRRAVDILTLAKERSPEGARILEELAATQDDGIDVLLGAPSSNGVCFGALRIHPGEGKMEAGFRLGHMPRRLLVQRRLGKGVTVTKTRIDRADHGWIHGRDQDRERQDVLKGRRVAVIGVGSVGSSVATLLAKSGVGNLLLLDLEVMEWPNVSRHELGAESVGVNKARALAQREQAA